MSTAKQIVANFHSIRNKQGVMPLEFNEAKLKAVSDVIHLQIPAAVPIPHSEKLSWTEDFTKAYIHDLQQNKAIPLFMSEGDWVKVPVYLKVGQQLTYVGSIIAHFTNDNILISFSNRLLKALSSNEKIAGELNQLDVDLAMTEENLRNTIVAASSGSGKKLSATSQEILSGIKDKGTHDLCKSILDFLRENNPFQSKYKVTDALKQKHCEQLSVLTSLLTSPETSKGSVQMLKEINGQINPWPRTVAGYSFMALSIGLFIAVFLEGIFLATGTFDPFVLGLDDFGTAAMLELLIMGPIFLGSIMFVGGDVLSREQFVLPREILNAGSTTPSVVVEQEQVSFQTTQTVVQEVQQEVQFVQTQASYVPSAPMHSMQAGISSAQGMGFSQQQYNNPYAYQAPLSQTGQVFANSANVGSTYPGQPVSQPQYNNPFQTNSGYPQSGFRPTYPATGYPPSFGNQGGVPAYGHPVSQPPYPPQHGYPSQAHAQTHQSASPGNGSCPPGYPPGYQQ